MLHSTEIIHSVHSIRTLFDRSDLCSTFLIIIALLFNQSLTFLEEYGWMEGWKKGRIPNSRTQCFLVDRQGVRLSSLFHSFHSSSRSILILIGVCSPGRGAKCISIISFLYLLLHIWTECFSGSHLVLPAREERRSDSNIQRGNTQPNSGISFLHQRPLRHR